MTFTTEVAEAAVELTPPVADGDTQAGPQPAPVLSLRASPGEARRRTGMESIQQIDEHLAASDGRTGGDPVIALLAATVLRFGEACRVAREGNQARADGIVRAMVERLIGSNLWFDEVDELHAACRLLIHRHGTRADAEVWDEV